MPADIALDRLVRKEVALGVIRELVPPDDHIGLRVVAPWLDVESDDVIFEYTKGMADGLAPARAEDAEAELAQKDDLFAGQGRASVIDWSLKDRYKASDVTRYREALLVAEAMRETQSLPLTIDRMLDGFNNRLARDQRRRRRKLDNRIEWLIMQSLEAGQIAYNDGKIKFTVPWGRPGGQTNAAPATGQLWSAAAADPIKDILAVQQFMFDTYGVRMDRAIVSQRILNSILNSDKFAARTGLVGATGAKPIDPYYLIDGWGPTAAVEVVTRATNLTFIPYDSVYRTRAIGSTTFVNNRFLSDNKVFFLPREADLDEFVETEIGFAKTLTSPHPMGNWGTGFYEWERETEDPWGRDMGTGVKAFPVFPHLDLTYTMTVL